MSVELHNIMEFNDITGLRVSSKGEILEDLKYLTRVAYGSDYVIEQGNEWYSFLDLLSGALVDISGAVQKVYNTLSFIGASGTNLDNVVSFVGITRKPYKNSTVLIKITLPEGSVRPYTIPERGIVLKDHNGNYWTNNEIIIVNEFKLDEFNTDGTQKENYIGTATFEATDSNADPTNIVLQPYNDGNPSESLQDINGVAPTGTVFMNELSSELGNLEETDAQLRSRYKAELYKNSVGTIEGLKAVLLDKADITYVYIVENNSEQTSEDGMPPHSIWVITDGKSTWNGEGNISNDPEDIKIGDIILNYASLGCVTTNAPDKSTYTGGTGPITTQISLDSSEYSIKFSRANAVPCYVNVTLVSDLADASKKNAIALEIKYNIAAYIKGLGIGNDVLQSGLSSAVYSVITENDYIDYVFDIDSITVGRETNPTTKRLSINVNEYSTITEDNISITWGGA